VKARTQAFLTLHGIVIGSPTVLRDDLVKLSKRALVRRCADLRPETEDLLALVEHPERLHLAAAQRTLRDLAERWLTLDAEVKGLDRQIKALVEQTAPQLVEPGSARATGRAGATAASGCSPGPPATVWRWRSASR
jgi:transposase